MPLIHDNASGSAVVIRPGKQRERERDYNALASIRYLHAFELGAWPFKSVHKMV